MCLYYTADCDVFSLEKLNVYTNKNSLASKKALRVKQTCASFDSYRKEELILLFENVTDCYSVNYFALLELKNQTSLIKISSSLVRCQQKSIQIAVSLVNM